MNTNPTHPGRSIPVHKDGHDGTIMIDHMTGQILTPAPSLPIWAEGLVSALVAERRTFYIARLGDDHGELSPESFNADDLGWLGIDEAGDEVEHDASGEHRMQHLAAILGFDMEEGTIDGAVTSVETEHSTVPASSLDEETLAEAEGKDFGSMAAEGKVAHGG